MADPFTARELLIATIARRLRGARHIAVGAASPIPAAAALLAQALSDGGTRVSLLGSREHNFFTDGGRELFDCAAQGRIDAFFLGGGEIDGEANVNLVGVGGYPASRVRFAGSYGSAYLYFLVPNVILFREEHSPRTLVERVAFISAPGTSPEGVYRPGGPRALITGRAAFSFDRGERRFRLDSVHPGHSAAEIAAQTGFAFDRPERVPQTPAPPTSWLALMRGHIGEQVAEAYPRFAAAAPAQGAGAVEASL